MTEATRSGTEPDRSFTLDLANRSALRPIGPELADPAAAKLVEVEIASVLNPKKIRLAFEVRYRPGEGEEQQLGSFALFPPDRPGKFLVATQGRLRSGGSLVLSMQVLDEVGPKDEVRVTVKRIALRRE